jgi:hypothetical protein
MKGGDFLCDVKGRGRCAHSIVKCQLNVVARKNHSLSQSCAMKRCVQSWKN